MESPSLLEARLQQQHLALVEVVGICLDALRQLFELVCRFYLYLAEPDIDVLQSEYVEVRSFLLVVTPDEDGVVTVSVDGFAGFHGGEPLECLLR